MSQATLANTETLKKGLECWTEDGPDDERAARIEAGRRILSCGAIADKRLELRHLKLTSLPGVLGELGHLEHLDVMNAGLMSVPPETGKLVQLKCLQLGGNDLHELPEEISNLKALQKLYLNANKFRSLPDWLGDLEHLQMLHVPWNLLDHLPEGLSRLQRLTDLDAHGNRLTELPEWLKRMNLRYLDVASNPIQDLGSFASGGGGLPTLIGGPSSLHARFQGSLDARQMRCLSSSPAQPQEPPPARHPVQGVTLHAGGGTGPEFAIGELAMNWATLRDKLQRAELVGCVHTGRRDPNEDAEALNNRAGDID